MKKPGRKVNSILNKEKTAQLWICEDCGELNLTVSHKSEDGHIYHKTKAECANCKTRFGLILDENA